ncbi:ABC transporter permease [Micromonospora sp. HUAS LYJ1]|uniref:ABC transporter permease n=1 Tax=Micromonospora sp. HUAS LYJ1 TaxID=3061626 RepID=UPI0026722ACE|nr:ABC transporter permease [Micromonospora sp. HUAS LYJ1]WKU03353.1 ABC transporter permease [Micromonospora sp. HUAS LYJ1]
MTATEGQLVRPRVAGDRSRVIGLGLGGGVVVGLLTVWWLLTDLTGTIRPLYFPAPTEVLSALRQVWRSMLPDAGATLLRVLFSWSIGSAAGILIGLLMVRSRILFHTLTPVIEALRPVPPVALIPFVILWFGIGDSGKLFLGSLACFMVMVVNTIVSANNVSPVYGRAARSLGAREGQVYRTVILPAIVPEIVSGLRIGSALAFAVVVAAEFLGAEQGIGRLIMQASRTLNTPVVLIGTIVIAIEAVAVDRLIKFVSSRITRWSESSS